MMHFTAWWLAGGLDGWGVGLPAVQERAWEWGWHPMWGMWGAWGLGVLLFMLLFWLVVLVGFILGLRWLMTWGRSPRPDPALETLRQRYARGEIGKEEFEAKKQDLVG